MEICEQRSPAVERSFPDLSEGYQQLGLPSTEKSVIAVEVCLKSKTTVRHEEIRLAVERMLDKRSLVYEDGPISISESDEPFLLNTFRASRFAIQLIEEGPVEELEANDSIASFHEWSLPAREFHGLWESVVLLHGPPGTGKTSICKALGQKLSIRFSHRYTHSQLVEVNAHSLFSKWFSESGKLVTKLFQKLQDIVEDGTTLVFVLIDEVESLAAARQAAFSGSEPSDSIRVVNALLTQLDSLKSWPNVFVLTTSNISAAVDVAFVDRADIKAYIGPPSVQARYEILKSCLRELRRVGIICQATTEPNTLELLSFKVLLRKINDIAENQQSEVFSRSRLLLTIADTCEGLSGRALRKLPFLAHASIAASMSFEYNTFLAAMLEAVKKELSDRAASL